MEEMKPLLWKKDLSFHLKNSYILKITKGLQK